MRIVRNAGLYISLVSLRGRQHRHLEANPTTWSLLPAPFLLHFLLPHPPWQALEICSSPFISFFSQDRGHSNSNFCYHRAFQVHLRISPMNIPYCWLVTNTLHYIKPRCRCTAYVWMDKNHLRCPCTRMEIGWQNTNRGNFRSLSYFIYVSIWTLSAGKILLRASTGRVVNDNDQSIGLAEMKVSHTLESIACVIVVWPASFQLSLAYI